MNIYYNHLPNGSVQFMAFLLEENELQVDVFQWLRQFGLEVIPFDINYREDLEEKYLELTNQYTVYYKRENHIVYFSNSREGFENETAIDELAENLLIGIHGFDA